MLCTVGWQSVTPKSQGVNWFMLPTSSIFWRESRFRVKSNLLIPSEECLKRSLHDYYFLGAISGIIIILDQVTKLLVRTYLPVNGIWAPWDWLMPYARLFHTQNTGVAFGMFQGANLIFAILAVIVSAAIIYYFPRVAKSDWTLRIALSMQLAGAVGNLIDRIFVGQVTDFISVGRFAVFNVAEFIHHGRGNCSAGGGLAAGTQSKREASRKPRNDCGTCKLRNCQFSRQFAYR